MLALVQGISNSPAIRTEFGICEDELPTAPATAVERTRSGAEQRASKTAIATLTAAPNGTYGPAWRDEPPVVWNLTFGPMLRRARPVDLH